MTKNKDPCDDADVTPVYRQVNITSLNESVLLLSSDKDENIKFLSNKGLELMNKLKQLNGVE